MFISGKPRGLSASSGDSLFANKALSCAISVVKANQSCSRWREISVSMATNGMICYLFDCKFWKKKTVTSEK